MSPIQNEPASGPVLLRAAASSKVRIVTVPMIVNKKPSTQSTALTKVRQPCGLT